MIYKSVLGIRDIGFLSDAVKTN